MENMNEHILGGYMKKIWLLVLPLILMVLLASCGEPSVVGYHIDENGDLIATLEDDTTKNLGYITDIAVGYHIDNNGDLIATMKDLTTKNLGSISDTIANGVNNISVSISGCYVINGIDTGIKAHVAKDYTIDANGNLLIEYMDGTFENAGKFGNDAVNTIQSIAISDDGYYILNGIKTSIFAVDVYEVKFVTGTSDTIKTQVLKEGDKATEPSVSREGYTFLGWYCNNAKWNFNTDIITDNVILTAKWEANEYRLTFSTGISQTVPNKTVTYDQQFTLPTLSREGYVFEGWTYNGNLIAAGTWQITKDCALVAKWTAKKYTVSINANGGTVSKDSVQVAYGESFSLPVPSNEYGVFLGWFYNNTQITDANGRSLQNWTYTQNIEVTTSWEIEIETADDLQKLHQYPNAYFELKNNIDISLVEWIPVGTENKPFTGTIDGGGHIINGLKITQLQGSQTCYGFIAYAAGGKICNLTFTNINISLPAIQNSVMVGGVIGYNKGASLKNITTTGNIILANHSGTYESIVGGLVGKSTVDEIQNCVNGANVSGKTVAGGIVGYKGLTTTNGLFKNNHNTGKILDANCVGGMMGYAEAPMILNCSNKGEIKGQTAAGGLVGFWTNGIYVEASYNTGAIETVSTGTSAYDGAGGLAGTYDLLTAGSSGKNIGTTFLNVYNTGKVTSMKYAGGIVAVLLEEAVVTNAYNSGSISGKTYTGGLVGLALYLTVNQSINHGSVTSANYSDSTLVTAFYVLSMNDCYYTCSTSGITTINGTKTNEKYSTELYVDSMFWSTDVWEFSSDKMPTLKQ